MFDFQQMKSMANQVSELSHQRHQQAEKNLKLGIQSIERFEQSGFQNIRLAKQSCQQLILSSRTNLRDMRPLLALIYLFALIGDHDTAQLYITLAQDIDPDDTYLLFMQDFCYTIKSGKPAASEDIDFDTLHNRTQQQIQALLQYIHQQPLSTPTIDEKELTPLKSNWEDLQKNIHTLIADLEVLEQQENTSEMHKSIYVLNQWVSRQEKCLQISQKMQALNQSISEQTLQIRDRYIEVKNTFQLDQVQSWETTLENQFDNCDQIADQMDELELQQIKLDCLLPAYHHLLGILEGFHDLIDDKKSQLLDEPPALAAEKVLI